MANQQVAELFKTSDLDPADKLYSKKKDCLDEVKRLFTTNLNYTNSHKYYENEQGEDTGLRNYQAEKKHDESRSRNHLYGLYCEPIFLQPQQVAYALEERKALLKWILTKVPWMNVPVAKPEWNAYIASVDTGEWTEDGSRKYCKFWVNPAQIIRERDWLFGTNDTPVITMANYREKVRAAQTTEEVKNLKKLLFNPLWDTRNPLFEERTADTMEKAWQKESEETNEFLEGVKFYVRTMLCRLAEINRAATEYYNRGKELKDRHPFQKSDITGPLGRLEKLMDNTEAGREARKGNRALDSLQLHAGMKWSQWVAYELLKNDEQYLNWDSKLLGPTFNGLTNTFTKARKKLTEKGITYHWKPEPTKPNLDSVSPPPAPTQQSEAPVPDPTDNSNPTEDMEKGSPVPQVAPLSEEEANQKLTEVKNKLKTAADKLKNPGSQPPKDSQKTLHQLEEQLKQLENGSDTSPETIAELKDQIAGLRKQLANTAPILVPIQEFFAKNTSVLNTVKQYFQKHDIKLIKLAGEEWIIEYNNGEVKTSPASSVPEFQEIKDFLQTASQKELTSQEVLGIDNNNSSPANSPDNKVPYIIGGIIIAVVVGGVIGLWWWKTQKKKEKY